jgi:hypothetical protein
MEPSFNTVSQDKRTREGGLYSGVAAHRITEKQPGSAAGLRVRPAGIQMRNQFL